MQSLSTEWMELVKLLGLLEPEYDFLRDCNDRRRQALETENPETTLSHSGAKGKRSCHWHRKTQRSIPCLQERRRQGHLEADSGGFLRMTLRRDRSLLAPGSIRPFFPSLHQTQDKRNGLHMRRLSVKNASKERERPYRRVIMRTGDNLERREQRSVTNGSMVLRLSLLSKGIVVISISVRPHKTLRAYPQNQAAMTVLCFRLSKKVTEAHRANGEAGRCQRYPSFRVPSTSRDSRQKHRSRRWVASTSSAVGRHNDCYHRLR